MSADQTDAYGSVRCSHAPECEERFTTLQRHSRPFLKCTKAGITHGAGTDIRKSWPACTLFRPART